MAILKISFILVIVYFVDAIDILENEDMFLGLKDFCNIENKSNAEILEFLNKIYTEHRTCLVENLNAAITRQNTSLEPPHDDEVSQKFRLYCDAAPSMFNCQQNLAKELKLCFDENKNTQTAETFKSFNEVQTLMCMNQGKRQTNMTDTDKCINKHVNLCFQTEWSKTAEFGDTEVGVFGATDKFIYIVSKSTRVQQTKSCINHGYFLCGAKIPSLYRPKITNEQ